MWIPGIELCLSGLAASKQYLLSHLASAGPSNFFLLFFSTSAVPLLFKSCPKFNLPTHLYFAYFLLAYIFLLEKKSVLQLGGGGEGL